MSYLLRDYQREIISKVKEHYNKGIKNVLVVSPCGSGKSVIICDILESLRKAGNRALFLVHRRELIEQMKRYTQDNDHVDLITVQSMVRRLNNYSSNYYNLIVTDETHHSGAGSYLKIYEHFKSAFRLGFTATPTRRDGQGLGSIYDAIVEGRSVRWLIDNNFLSDFSYYAPTLLDVKKLRKERREYSNESIDKQLTGVVFGDVIKHYKKLAHNKKTIVYCNTIKNAEIMAGVFKSAGYNAEAIHSKIKDTERSQMVEDFKNGVINVLVNVDLFGEGFDVPDCEVVILLRPTTSLTLFIQQAMRCMRYKQNKRALIIDHVGNVFKHGAIDEERDWELTKVKNNEKNENLNIKQCSNCFAVVRSTICRCPFCGFEFKAIDEKPALEVVEDAELKELKLEDLKTVKDFYKYAKQKGYKNGWAYYKAKELGMIKGGKKYGY